MQQIETTSALLQLKTADRKRPRPSPITRALQAAARGELPPPLPVRGRGHSARLARAANKLIERQRELFLAIAAAAEGTALPASADPLPGQFGVAREHVALLAWQALQAAKVAAALDRGDLSRSMSLEAPGGAPLEGQARRTAMTINSLVRRLGAIRSEVIRSPRRSEPPEGWAAGRKWKARAAPGRSWSTASTCSPPTSLHKCGTSRW